MDLSDKCCDPTGTGMECVRILKGLGEEIQHNLFRVIFYEEGRMEVEFQARNPWECLVLKLDSWNEALDSLKNGLKGTSLFKNAVIRKKCTKCFLHEREATSSDI
jgi:hypothetical protein